MRRRSITTTNVFRWARSSGTIELVSVGLGGAPAVDPVPRNGLYLLDRAGSTDPAVSDDGRFVAFASNAMKVRGAKTGLGAAYGLFRLNRAIGWTPGRLPAGSPPGFRWRIPVMHVTDTAEFMTVCGMGWL